MRGQEPRSGLLSLPDRMGAWLLRLGVLALLAALVLGAWSLVWNLALLPRAQTWLEGFYVVTHGQENLKGPVVSRGRAPQAALTLSREHTSLEARGVWLVPEDGVYRLRLECDDYGQVKVDGRTVVAVHGYRAHNQGQGQIHLRAGSHLMVIELDNGPGQGWLKLAFSPPGSQEWSDLPSSQFCPLPVDDLAFWLDLVAMTQRPLFQGLAATLALILFVLFLPGRREQGWGRTLGRNAVNLGLLLVSCLVALTLAEVVVRMLEPVELRVRGNQIQLTKDHRTEISQDKCEKITPRLVHSKNSLGFRGPNPPSGFDGSLTLVCVGGSTTECYYLDDADTWPQRLAQLLRPHFKKLWVNNAGLDGHSTRGHLFLVKDYLAPIKPKVVLFLVGINEVGRDRLSKYDAWLVDMAQGKDTGPQPSWFQRVAQQGLGETLAEHSHLAALLVGMHRAQTAAQQGLSHGCIAFAGLPRQEVEPAREQAMLAEHRSHYLHTYGERLRKLVDLTRAAGMEPVLITQPVLWGEGIDPTTGRDLATLATQNLAGEPGWNGASMWRLMELYNEQTRLVGAKKKVWVVDLARLMPKDSALFYDWAHFTAPGARQVAEIVSQELCPFLARRFASWVRKPCPRAARRIESTSHEAPDQSQPISDRGGQ